MLRPTRQNRRDPNFFFAISDFYFFFRGFRALRSYAENRHQRRRRTSKIISVRPDSKGMSYIPISFRMISRGNVKHVDDLTCAQNIGSLSFTACHMHCGRSVKSNCNIAGTLDLSSYERAKLSWRQNILRRLISGYQLHSLQFNNKVTVGNPFSRRGGSLCYVHVLKKYPANVNIK